MLFIPNLFLFCITFYSFSFAFTFVTFENIPVHSKFSVITLEFWSLFKCTEGARIYEKGLHVPVTLRELVLNFILSVRHFVQSCAET